VVRQPFF